MAQCSDKPKRIAFGVAPLGIISIGIVPMGVVSIGVVPMGVISIGVVGMGEGGLQQAQVPQTGHASGLLDQATMQLQHLRQAQPAHQASRR